ncbi:hypothetical protein BDV93DRAFT_515699 [Ceratobasidium sp. AG-I]|nr:hypothetical protein BDV93DRAFT_515699 [Ceratobasidium sp. AG-I]
MRGSGCFTLAERRDIDSFLPEMRRLKRTVPLATTINDDQTGYDMSVAAALRLRLCRRLVMNHPTIYRNLKDPKVFFRYISLDSRLKGYFEYKMRDIEAVRPKVSATPPIVVSDSSDEDEEFGSRDSSTDSNGSDSEADLTHVQRSPAAVTPRARGNLLTQSSAQGREKRKQLLKKLRDKQVNAGKMVRKRPKRFARKFPLRVVSPSPSSSSPEIELLGPFPPQALVQGSGEDVPSHDDEIYVSDSTSNEDVPAVNAAAVGYRPIKEPRSSILRTPRTGRQALLLDLGIPNFTLSSRDAFS